MKTSFHMLDRHTSSPKNGNTHREKELYLQYIYRYLSTLHKSISPHFLYMFEISAHQNLVAGQINVDFDGNYFYQLDIKINNFV